MGILITGGSGFVGLNVAEQLLARGDDVVLFGPIPPPAPAAQALAAGNGKLSFFAGDVTIPQDLDYALGKHSIGKIVHAAAITASLERERHSAREIFLVNTIGTIEVLDAALRHGVRRVVQLGTGSIFGAAGNLTEVLDEQTSPAVPETLYGISKYAAERAGLRYRNTRALDLVVARLGTVFGRWEYDTGVRDTLSLPFQLLQVAQDAGLAVIRDNAADDWVYSVDVARAVMMLLDADRVPEPVYHVSAGTRWSVADWCERLQGRFPRFRYRFTARADECTVGRSKAAPRSPMSIERLRRDMGYEPRYLADRAFRDYMQECVNRAPYPAAS